MIEWPPSLIYSTKVYKRQRKLTKAVALNIKKYRKDKGISQHTLAETMGTRQSAIARMESQSYRAHSLTSLIRVSVALDVTVGDLLKPPQPIENNKKG
jgi:transcriptional regulator with XRE-family HTH domain